VKARSIEIEVKEVAKKKGGRPDRGPYLSLWQQQNGNDEEFPWDGEKGWLKGGNDRMRKLPGPRR